MASGLRRPCDAHKQTVIMRLPRERRRIRIASYSVGYELSDVEIKSIATLPCQVVSPTAVTVRILNPP